MTPLLASSSALGKWLRSVLRHIPLQDPVKILTNLLDARDALNRLRDEFRYHGMYQVLDYDASLEICDSKGRKAILTRREVIRLLQDNVVAVHDHAWGDGELFARYRCQPGVPVDFYEDGSKHNVLISLRETKDRGDTVKLWIERVIKDGFLEAHEWFETEIDHLMRNLRMSVVFPKSRPCRRATLTRRSTGKTILLSQSHFALLPDGRQRLTWDTKRPKLHDLYTIKWTW